ncbi:MAG: aminotransferase class V-fold PLP-dependent enzyme, partial [Pseudomonadota bacterium]
VQIDTASGVWNDVAAIGDAIRAAGHPALYMVDGIASIGCVPFEQDAWGVDLALTGSQKGLMTPPGLSFLSVNQRTRDRLETADLRTRYWDWGFREGELHYEKYCGTPPEHLLFGLRRALDMLLEEEGLEAAWARHAHLAAAARAAVERWAECGVLSINVLNPAERSDTVTCVLTAPGYSVDALRAFTAQNLGVTLGSGIGDFTGGAFRIATMGHANAPSVMATLSAAEIAFKALGWPHGEGALAAAAARLADAVAPAAQTAQAAQAAAE